MALVQVNPGKLGPRLRPHSQGPACDAKIPPVDLSSPRIPDVWMPVCGTTQMHAGQITLSSSAHATQPWTYLRIMFP